MIRAFVKKTLPLLAASVLLVFASLAVARPALAAEPTAVSVKPHVQTYGWMNEVADGTAAGTTGQAKRVEAFKFGVVMSDGTVDYSAISARAHVQTYGWQNWVSGGQIVGTEGQRKRVEAVQLQLSDTLRNQGYHVYYRVHVQSFGWTAWASDGALCGTQGMAKRLEAIQVQIVRDGQSPQDKGVTSAVDWSFRDAPKVTYSVHQQTYGWEGAVSNGTIAGVTGRAKRLESLTVSVGGSQYSGGVTYRVHQQTYGWSSWSSNGTAAGVTGRAKRLEAVQIALTGDLASHYDIYYRVHSQTFGWLSWAKNGASAGSAGLAKRVEAIQIVLVLKGGAAPGDTSMPYVEAPQATYAVTTDSSSWSANATDGATAGSEGSTALQGLRATLKSTVGGGISYTVRTVNSSDTATAADGGAAGAAGKQVNCVQMSLTGNAAKYFDIYYRAYVTSAGWLGWASNGQQAGTQGKNQSIAAVQVKVVAKNASAPGSTSRHYVAGASYIYLDAGHGWSSGSYDPGAQGSGYSEAKLTAALAKKVAQYARSLYGVHVFLNTDEGQDLVSYKGRQADAVDRGCTSLVAIHFNATSGSTTSATGSESYIHSVNAAPGADQLQTIMHRHLVAGVGLTDRGRRTAKLAVCSGANGGVPGVLLEVCFINNPRDMAVYNARMDTIARELAKGLYEASEAGF